MKYLYLVSVLIISAVEIHSQSFLDECLFNKRSADSNKDMKFSWLEV